MSHSRSPGFHSGNHWNVCQRCGFDTLASECKKEWTGLIVCHDCWEPRHIGELIRPRTDHIMARDPVTGKPSDTFVAIGYGLAIAGIAIAGDAIAGKSETSGGAEVPPSGTFGSYL